MWKCRAGVYNNHMKSKILTKWLCITLMCAILFGALGFGYGQMMTTEKCNNYWNNNIDSVCNIRLLTEDSQTISTDNTKIHLDRIKLNITPIEVKINE